MTRPYGLAAIVETQTWAAIRRAPILKSVAGLAATQQAERVRDGAQERMAYRQAVHADERFLARKKALSQNESEGDHHYE